MRKLLTIYYQLSTMKKQPKAYWKEMTTHYKELYEVALKELRFKNMKVDYLLSVFDEIEAFTYDKLVKGVIDNAKERNHLDSLIHYREVL